MMPLHEIFQQHPWWTGLLVSVVAFVLNGIRRFKVAEARMSNEQKLALRLYRAAMAFRKLGRAQRLLARYLAIRTAAPEVPMAGMVRRLWRADRDAAAAADHLAAVLRQIARIGAPAATLAALDRRMNEAREVREACRQYVRSSVPFRPAAEAPNVTAHGASRHEGVALLGKVQTALAGWRSELARAEASLSRTVDPTILRSGGTFRNPFKPETATEHAQTNSIVDLRESQQDLHRAERCVTTLESTFELLKHSADLPPKELATMLGDALDEVDACLGEAELPLPPALARGESPADDAGAPASGALQRIYQLLVEDEVAAWMAIAANS
jgi:hypothetical protein